MDYTQYDYQSLVSEITSRLAEKEGWGEGYQSTTGQMLIQLFADSTDALMYMLERRVQEAFIPTALLESSIYAHASELGYRPRRTVCNTGTVRLSISEPAEADINIPKYTKLTYNGEYDFVTTESKFIPAGGTFVDIPIKEGKLVTLKIQPDDENLNEFGDIVIEDYLNIDQYSLEVDDNGEKYFDVEEAENDLYNYGSLSYAGSEDTVYDIKYGVDGMRIVFGDDVFGRYPKGTITVSYIETGGMIDPILSDGIEFSFEKDYLYDENTAIPRKQYEYTLVNITPIRGFSVHESVEEIARNAPEYARANNRAVTKSDYEFWGVRSGIGGIVDVSAFGEEESGSLIFNMNNVIMTYITSDETPINTEQEISFRTYMNRYVPLTTHIVVDEAKKIEAVLNVKFKKNTQVPITLEQAYIEIKSMFEEYFKIERGSIGGALQHSELVKHVQEKIVEINGVKYELTDFVKIEIQPQYELDLPLPSYNLYVYLDTNYIPSSGDVFSLVIDDTPVSITVSSGDTQEDVVGKMSNEIKNNPAFELLTAIGVSGSGVQFLRIQSKYPDQVFYIDTNAGTIANSVTTNKKLKLPASKIYNTTLEDMIVPSSVSIIDEDGVVKFQDDGNGVMVSMTGGASFTIDYRTAELINPYVEDTTKTHYVRFQQDEFQNIQAAKDSVIVLSKFADYIDEDDKFSKIEFIS